MCARICGDNAVPSRADQGGLTEKKLNLASVSRPSAFTSTSCPPSGSTFRPDQVASRLRKQRARREGKSRKVVRSSRRGSLDVYYTR